MRKVVIFFLSVLSVIALKAQYNVGNDDGFSASNHAQADNPYLAIYSVGNGDGSEVTHYPALWVGVLSTDWNTAANWNTNSVVAADQNVELSLLAKANCVLDADRSVSNVINYSDKNIALNGHTLTIKAGIDQKSTGKIDASATGSTLKFAGTAAQNLSDSVLNNNEVYNLTSSNESNVALTGNISLLNSISVTNNGRFDAVTNTPTLKFAGTTSQTIPAGVFTSDQIYNLTIDNSAGVIQNSDLTVTHDFTINAAKWYQINAAKLLSVNGTVTNTAGSNGLFIKAGNETDANASFIYPQNQTVQATVEFYSKAWWNLAGGAGGKYKWQYFGIPVSAASNLTASPTFDGAYVRKYNEAGNGAGISNSPVKLWLQLTNTSVLEPFAGYEIVQSAAKTYSISGNLVNNDYNSGALNYTTGADYPGKYILSNPYTASVDITQLDFGTETEAAVYQYHTGSYNDWQSHIGNYDGTAAGQYRVSPKNTAGQGGIPRYISSMQGFMIRKLNLDNSNLSNFTFGIPYNSVRTKNTTPMRAKRAELSYTIIDVEGSRFADKAWIFVNENCSKEFDNGWDGRKMLGSSGTPQLAIRENTDDLQISATNDINNTVLAFKAGEDTSYKLKFTHFNINYPELYLIDTETGVVTDIKDSLSVYSFTASPTTDLVNRFKITTGRDISTQFTGIDNSVSFFANENQLTISNKSANEGVVKIFDMLGRVQSTKVVHPNQIVTYNPSLISGNYIVKFESETHVLCKKIKLE